MRVAISHLRTFSERLLNEVRSKHTFFTCIIAARYNTRVDDVLLGTDASVPTISRTVFLIEMWRTRLLILSLALEQNKCVEKVQRS